MMEKNVSVSVVIPAFEAQDYLEATLTSVAEQTLLPGEVIVVDDGSSDATVQVAENFASTYPELNVRILKAPHLGPGAARNAGIDAAKGEWIAFLDSDDRWLPGKLEAVVNAISLDQDVNIVCHSETVTGPEGGGFVADYGALFFADQTLPAQLYRRNLFSTSAVVCKRDILKTCGGFDATLSSAQDYELWLRMSPALKPFFIRRVLGTYVLRDGNISSRRFFKRLLNLLRIKIRHRGKARNPFWFLNVMRTVAVHFFVPVRGLALRVISQCRRT